MPRKRRLAAAEDLGEAGGMTPAPATYRRHRFPAEIISHAVWLYHVFSLSLRDVELILAERSVAVTHESVRRWCLKFGQEFARKLRKRRPRPGDTWHLDEVFIRMNGVVHCLWRAVDQHGVVLDILVQGRRNATAAKRFFRRLLSGLKYKPRRLVTDGCAATAWPGARSCPRRGTGPAVGSTTVRRTRIGRRGGASARCSGSSRPSRPSGSSRRTPSSTATSARGGTSCRPTSTAAPAQRPSGSGGRRLASRPRRDPRRSRPCGQTLLSIR